VPQRLGLLGGTFDPPHVAHLVAAIHTREQLALDEVVLMVAHEPWQKTDQRMVTPSPTRFAMVQAAVAGLDGLRAGDEEIRRGGQSYTIDTVEELLRAEPSTEIFVIIGEDAALGFHTWHRHVELAQLINLVIVNRSHSVAKNIVPDGVSYCEHVTIPYMDISSSDIRERVRSGESIDFLVRSSVRDIIYKEHLYTGNR